MKKNIWGLLLVGLLAFVANYMNLYLLPSVEAITIGILLAIIIRNTIGINTALLPGIGFSAKELLKWGVVLLGLRLNLVTLSGLGYRVIILIVLVVIIGHIAALIIGRLFKLNTLLSLLLGVGSSICGSSAIVAMGPIIEAEEEDITLAVAIISLLGTIGVLLFSFFSSFVSLSDSSFGIWTGSSLQNVAHALAAALPRGEEAVDIAAIVKMGRVTLLAPLAIILKFVSEKFIHRENKAYKRVKFPEYVIYFLLLGLFASINDYFQLIPLSFTTPIELDVLKLAKTASSWLLMASMIAMGLQTDIRALKSAGLRAFVTCSLVFATLIAFSYGMIRFFV